MMEIKRRAPKKGYDNESKSNYRENVWKKLAPNVIPILNSDEKARVLLLPSKEGLEIDTAIKYGVNPAQIIAIDENPALLAHAKWKHKIPKENRYGCKVSQIGEKIKKRGWYLAGANLDFCNQFSQELINESNSFLNNTPISDDFYFFITMAKGRESSALFLILKELEIPQVFNFDRLGAFYFMLKFDDKIILSLDFQDQYRSNRMPMIYAMFSIKKSLINKCGNIHSKELLKINKRRKMLPNLRPDEDNYKTVKESNKKFDQYKRIKKNLENSIERCGVKHYEEMKLFSQKHNIINVDEFISMYQKKLSLHHFGYNDRYMRTVECDKIMSGLFEGYKNNN